MASLKLKSGSPVEVKKGHVELTGPCVVLLETRKNLEEQVVLAHHLSPGDTVRRVGEGEYIVEF